MGEGSHGLSYTPEYRAWQQLRLRCMSPKHAAFARYGGRGITVCASWAGSVERFVEDMGPRPTPKHEIDRVDNDAGYWCGKCAECVSLARQSNCRWVTREENDRNRRSNRLLTLNGETLTLVEWAARTGISAGVLSKRLAGGWSVRQALTTPTRTKGRGVDEEVTCVVCARAFVRHATKYVARVTCSKACAKARSMLRHAKLSVEDVEAARAERERGATIRELAERFGISPDGMKKVLSGDSFDLGDPHLAKVIAAANRSGGSAWRVA